MCTRAFEWYQKSITLDDFERFRITISSEMAILNLFTQKYIANDK